MAWTLDFVNRLGLPRITPIYVIEAITLPGDLRPIGGNLLISSSREVAGAKAVLSPEGSRVSYGTLQVREWSYTTAEWEIGLLSQDLAGYDIRHVTTRGQAVALRIGFPGQSYGLYQTVALGVVQQIGSVNGRWTMRVRSILAALTTRNSTTSGEQQLFHRLAETELTAAYTAGVDTFVEVLDNDAAEKEPGGKYAVRVTPDDAEIDPFILTGTGISVAPDRISTLGLTPILGGTASDAAVGNRVEILAYVQDHPFRAARKILTSTGVAAANGAYDTLPASFGLGFPDEYIDGADCELAASHHSPNAAPAAIWDIYAAEEQEDALGFLQGVLAPMGGFLCERQGAITIRGVSTHYGQPGVMRQWDCYDSDIVSIDGYEFYDQTTPVEYSRWRAVDAHGDATTLDSAAGEEVNSRPTLATHRVDLPYVDTDRTAWREHIRDAIGAYSTRIGEPVTLTLRGWTFAQLAPGDHLQVHTSSWFLSGRSRALGSDLSEAAPLMVTSVEPDWFGASVRIRGTHLPDGARG